MGRDDNEEALLRSVALQNARAVFLARERAERELLEAKRSLEQKNQELAQQREWFRVTLSSIGDAVITTDIEGKITFLNPVAEAMTGWRSDEVLGQSVESVFRIINEVTRQPAPNPIVKVLREGTVVDLANHTSLLSKDGREIAIEDSAAPIREASGKMTGAVMVFHDVTERRRGEDAIEKAAERLQLALAAGKLGDWSWDAETELVTLGERAAELFGIAAGVPITWTDLRQLLHEEDRERARLAVEEALAHKKNYETEYRVRQPSGEFIWIAAKGHGLYRPGGAVMGMIGVVADITARRREEEIRSTLAAVVESSDDAIVSTTLDGTITTWNEGAHRIYGFVASEVIGKPVTVLIPPDRQDEEPAIIERLKKGERIDHYETLRQRKDGSLVDVSLSVSPIRDASGTVIGASKIARDITQSKHAEEALKRSEEQLRLVTDAIPGLISYIDADFRYRFVNREYERWFDHPATDLVGKRVDDVLGEEATRRLMPFLKRAMAGERVHFEMEVPYRDGGVRSVNGFYIPDIAENKKVRGIYVLVLDVSERKRAEQALRESEARFRQLADSLERQVAERTAHLKESIDSLEAVCYTIAHDLRAPLRAVQGFTKVLLEEYAPSFDAVGQQLATRIVHAATRMDVLIQDLLRYAKLSHVELPYKNVALDEMVRKVREVLSSEIIAKHAEINIAPLPVVCANPTIVEQVFTNLLTNSLKFVRPGVPPKVDIWSEAGEHRPRVFVQDNGIGIPPEHHLRVFGMFQRLHGDEKTYPGTGVGLAIVKKGLERIGANVGIQKNDQPGVCFYLDFRQAESK